MRSRHDPLACAALVCGALLWLSCASPGPQDSGATGLPDTPRLRLYVFDCGNIDGLDAGRFLPGDDEVPDELSLVNRCYLVQHPKGLLLWDAGLPDLLSSWWARTFVWIVSLGALDARVERTLASQLAEIGVSPSEIDYLAFSHLHTDHVGNANAFTSSTWLVQRTELDEAFSGDSEIFDDSYYDEIRENPREVLDGDFDVFGDGTVVILSAPGHTPGHQCLFLDLEERGPVVLSGDLYHTRRNRELRLPARFNTDFEQSRASMERIERFVAERGATLWIQHDPVANEGIPLSPTAIE